MRVHATRPEWERRREHLRRQILSAAGLFPMPPLRALNVERVRLTLHDGYATEAVLMETLPGYFVGGTVYRPLDTTLRHPAVLIPHGHWKHGRVEHLPTYSVPALGINLALQGYVAFSWDMAGYNDTRQTGHSFGGRQEQLWGFNPMGLQLWNSIRAIDYIASRNDVDARRIGCTGASGGGTQTILLTAVDDRIACSAPVNMISAHYQGADPCEEAPNLRLGTNNVEIASMMAPRPMLVISCTGDWTKNTQHEEFPALQRTYSLYGRVDLVENEHFDAEHNYDRHSREAAYEFFARHLLGRAGEKPEDVAVGEIDTAELLAYANGSRPPADALEYDELFAQWRAGSRQQNASAGKNTLREQLKAALGCEWPERVDAKQWGEYLLLTRSGLGDRVPALWLEGRGSPLVVVHPKGKEAARAVLKRDGRPALLLDPFQTGTAEAEREGGGKWYLSYNQTDDAHRVQDILTALRYAEQRIGRRASLTGFDEAGVWCTFAAAVAPYAVGWKGSDEGELIVPCIERAGGLEAALRILTD